MRIRDLFEADEPVRLKLGTGMKVISMDDDQVVEPDDEEDEEPKPMVIKLGSKRASSASQRFMQEFEASTDEHPFTRGMRYFSEGPVMVKMAIDTDYDDEVQLVDIQSKARGAGAKALNTICAIADNADVTIALYACGYAHVPTDKLVEYYERFGFKIRNPSEYAADGVDMIRYPE